MLYTIFYIICNNSVWIPPRTLAALSQTCRNASMFYDRLVKLHYSYEGIGIQSIGLILHHIADIIEQQYSDRGLLIGPPVDWCVTDAVFSKPKPNQLVDIEYDCYGNNRFITSDHISNNLIGRLRQMRQYYSPIMDVVENPHLQFMVYSGKIPHYNQRQCYLDDDNVNVLRLQTHLILKWIRYYWNQFYIYNRDLVIECEKITGREFKYFYIGITNDCTGWFNFIDKAHIVVAVIEKVVYFPTVDVKISTLRRRKPRSQCDVD